MQALPATSVKNYLNREQLELRAHLCTQLIVLASDQVAVLLADMTQKEVLGLSILETGNLFEKGIFELKALMKELPFGDREYQQTHLFFDTPFYTFVPEPLFVSEKMESFLTLENKLPRLYQVYQSRMEGKVNVYAAPGLFCNSVRVMYPGATIRHSSAALLKAFGELADKLEKEHLYVNVQKQYMEAFHFRNGQLHFHNIFPYEADTDIVYFILSVAEHLRLGDKLQVTMSGCINANGALPGLLKKYIPRVELLQRPDLFSYPASFREFQDQQHFTVIASLLCE